VRHGVGIHSCLLAILPLVLVQLSAAEQATADQEGRAVVQHPSTLAGTYVGELPGADTPTGYFRLSLRLDGTAIWRETYEGKNPIVSEGNWVGSPKQVTLSFSSSGGAKARAPITWNVDGHKLAPAAWDHVTWGANGPPSLTRLVGGTKRIPEKPIRR